MKRQTHKRNFAIGCIAAAMLIVFTSVAAKFVFVVLFPQSTTNSLGQQYHRTLEIGIGATEASCAAITPDVEEEVLRRLYDPSWNLELQAIMCSPSFLPRWPIDRLFSTKPKFAVATPVAGTTNWRMGCSALITAALPFVIGMWMLIRARAPLPGADCCQHCGYCLRGASTNICSECGKPHTHLTDGPGHTITPAPQTSRNATCGILLKCLWRWGMAIVLWGPAVALMLSLIIDWRLDYIDDPYAGQSLSGTYSLHPVSIGVENSQISARRALSSLWLSTTPLCSRGGTALRLRLGWRSDAWSARFSNLILPPSQLTEEQTQLARQLIYAPALEPLRMRVPLLPPAAFLLALAITQRYIVRRSKRAGVV